jgi:hypothetical protein
MSEHESEIENIEFETLVYTRYLYAVLEVKQSLLIALLEKQLDEALFWAYELYYSGFTHNVYSYAFNIYNEFYKPDNPELEKPIQNAINAWLGCDRKELWHLGSIITTLCYSKYQMNVFMESYFNLKCKPVDDGLKKRALFIRMKPEELVKYETWPRDMNELPRFYLKKVCKYAIRKETNCLFKTEFVSNREDYCNNWLYYAANSPVWQERIYGGVMNHATKRIDFETDDDFDAFYDEWGLEPDEQSIEVQEKSIGNGNEKQLSMKEFCEKYGGVVVTKTLKIRASVAALANSFAKLEVTN